MMRVNEVAADLFEMSSALCGIKNPARFRVGTSNADALTSGRWFDYTVSRGQLQTPVSQSEHLPCIGELVSHWSRWERIVADSLRLIQSSPSAARLLVPGLVKLEQALLWLPAVGHAVVARIQRRLRDGLLPFDPGIPRSVKPDIRNQFTFQPLTPDGSGRGSSVAEGWLGIPSRVLKHDRDGKAHRFLNQTFPGDHAGHLFGKDFGGPAGLDNLEPQNSLMNAEGTYWELERSWGVLLEQGFGIKVRIEVVGRNWSKRTERPDRRHVSWMQIAPDGTQDTRQVTFLDRPITPEQRKSLREQQKLLEQNPVSRDGFTLQLIPGGRS